MVPGALAPGGHPAGHHRPRPAAPSWRAL